MPQSLLRLIEKCAEFISKDRLNEVLPGLRGISVLYRHDVETDKYNVLYVGMASFGRGGVRDRLFKHARSKRKGHLWTHFSIFKVWNNIRDEEVAELEGLFRHIYRKDARANSLNIQRGHKNLKKLQQNRLREWGAAERQIR